MFCSVLFCFFCIVLLCLYIVLSNAVLSCSIISCSFFYQDDIPISNFVDLFGRSPLVAWHDDKLGETLATFKREKSHIAVVRTVNNLGQVILMVYSDILIWIILRRLLSFSYFLLRLNDFYIIIFLIIFAVLTVNFVTITLQQFLSLNAYLITYHYIILLSLFVMSYLFLPNRLN